MKSNHTPGPWILCEAYFRIAVMADKETICIVPKSHNDLENARVISAAPNIFAALKDVQLHLKVGSSIRCDKNLTDRIDDAIAKATGEL